MLHISPVFPVGVEHTQVRWGSGLAILLLERGRSIVLGEETLIDRLTRLELKIGVGYFEALQDCRCVCVCVCVCV